MLFQFFQLNGKRFGFTFIADITHDDFNMISTADDDTAIFLSNLLKSGQLRDTLLFVMGDHGPRYGIFNNTLIKYVKIIRTMVDEYRDKTKLIYFSVSQRIVSFSESPIKSSSPISEISDKQKDIDKF